MALSDLGLGALTIEDTQETTPGESIKRYRQGAKNEDVSFIFAGDKGESAPSSGHDGVKVIFAEDEKKTLQPAIHHRYDSNARKPVNFFDHKYLFRVICSSSPPQSQKGDVQSRLYPPPKLEDLPTNEAMKKRIIKDYAFYHRWDIPIEGPLISTTTDILRAFNIAWRLLRQRKTAVRILVIDTWQLHPGSYVKGNVLQSRVGLKESNLFKTETIVWGEIPAEAIICDWSWETLQSSGLFELFPGLIKNDVTLEGKHSERTLDTLRSFVTSQVNQFTTLQLVNVLVDDLGMDPSTYITHQMALIMLGWAKAKAHLETDSYSRLHRILEISGDISTLRRELHWKDLEIGRRKKEEVFHFLAEKEIDTSSFQHLLTESIDRSYPPIFSVWAKKTEDTFSRQVKVQDELARNKCWFKDFVDNPPQRFVD